MLTVVLAVDGCHHVISVVFRWSLAKLYQRQQRDIDHKEHLFVEGLLVCLRYNCKFLQRSAFTDE